jgi:hypothetical protein
MQNVSDNYEEISKDKGRKVVPEVSIDWDSDGSYTDEVDNLDSLSVERESDEPQSAVFSAQADVSLINNDNNYEVNKIDIPADLKVAFGAEDALQIFTGKSELPKITRQRYEMHFWDEMKKLRDFTLPHATGFQDIRTDLYIYEILKAYWGDDYEVIHNCDSLDVKEIIIDSYKVNVAFLFEMYDTRLVGQSFDCSPKATLTNVQFKLAKSGSPTGNAYVKLYAHTGTYGTSSKPTGAAVATSDALDVATLSTSEDYIDISFSDEYIMSNKKYCIVFSYDGGDASNYVKLYIKTDGSHGGNAFYSSDGGANYTAYADDDLVFSVTGLTGWYTADMMDTVDVDTTDYMEGTGSLTCDTEADADAFGVINEGLASIDLTDYTKVNFWLSMPEEVAGLNVEFRIGNNSSNHYYWSTSTDFQGNTIKTGWHLLQFDFADAEPTGSPDISDITYVSIAFSADTEQTLEEIKIDDIHATKGFAFYHDKGLRDISIANFARNKALYELKTACEAEGGRFYIDEQGNYTFENRQHYVVNLEHKDSVSGFTFNNMFDYIIPNDESKIINKVIFKINKRIEQDLRNHFL